MFPQVSTYRPNPLSTNGLGAYYAPKYEQPISGLGADCGCSGGAGAIIGNDASYPSPGKIALALGAVGVVVYLVLKIKL